MHQKNKGGDQVCFKLNLMLTNMQDMHTVYSCGGGVIICIGHNEDQRHVGLKAERKGGAGMLLLLLLLLPMVLVLVVYIVCQIKRN